MMFEPEASVRRVARHEYRVPCPPQGWTTGADVQDGMMVALAGVRTLLGEDASRGDDALRVTVDGDAVVFWFDVDDGSVKPLDRLVEAATVEAPGKARAR